MYLHVLTINDVHCIIIEKLDEQIVFIKSEK